MKLNNKNIKHYFHAEICSFDYQPMQMEHTHFQADSGNVIFGNRYKVAPQQRTLEMEFFAESDISKFMAELIKQNSSELDIEDGFIYEIALEGNISTSRICDGYYSVSIPVYAIQKGHFMKVKLKTGRNLIKVKGTYPSPCIYKIVFKQNVSNLNLAGNQIKNNQKNDCVILDGIHKTITRNGINCFKDVDLKNNVFPYLQLGMNAFEASESEADILLEYYPIYL